MIREITEIKYIANKLNIHIQRFPTQIELNINGKTITAYKRNPSQIGFGSFFTSHWYEVINTENFQIIVTKYSTRNNPHLTEYMYSYIDTNKYTVVDGEFLGEIELINIPYKSLYDDQLAMYKYNKSYRKQVWHKVADGDLPEVGKLVLCRMVIGVGNIYTIGFLNRNNIWYRYDTDRFLKNSHTISFWTELHKYKE